MLTNYVFVLKCKKLAARGKTSINFDVFEVNLK